MQMETEDVPAQDDGLLPVDPHAHQATVLVVVVVAGGSDAGPDEPAVGEDGTQSCKVGWTWSNRSQITSQYV